MIIARYTQTVDEVKAYKIDYTSWLDDGETIISAFAEEAPVTVPELTLATTILGVATQISLTIGGGVVNTDYVVKLTTTTSGSQIKEDCIEISVVTACV